MNHDNALNNVLDYELLPVSSKIYGYNLKQTRTENKEKGSPWRQKEIAREIGIGERTLQKYETGEVLPEAKIRNELANWYNNSLLRFVPPDIETAASLDKRFDEEMYAIECFAKFRSNDLRKEIKILEDEYKKAVARNDIYTRCEIDCRLHRICMSFHPDSRVGQWLIPFLKTRIDCIGLWVSRLGILDHHNRALLIEEHQNILHFSHAGSVTDILYCMEEHRKCSIKDTKYLEKFFRSEVALTKESTKNNLSERVIF